jgi:hypothetical protein
VGNDPIGGTSLMEFAAEADKLLSLKLEGTVG